MPDARLSSHLLLDALARLSQRLTVRQSSPAQEMAPEMARGMGQEKARDIPGEAAGNDFELLVVGGAAGILGGNLAPGRTTLDCDIMVVAPSDDRAWKRLRDGAMAVARELGLSSNWLNDGARAWRDTLPADWRDRRILALDLPSLRIFIPSRADFIVMKIMAGRDQDIEDLRHVAPTRDELAFARSILERWPHDHWPQSRINVALETLGAIEAETELSA
jgi:hypothetical protein